MFSARLGLLLLSLIPSAVCSMVSGGGGSPGGSSGYYSDSVIRNLDTQLLRIGSRLDQLMIRMDHLDSRVGRVQSTGHLRFDSIETSMQTTRQRLDLWSNQLNLIEEQLTRKWKNMESRFDSLVSTLDSKLDTKFNLIQRDNRRHNEFISQALNNVIISNEKMGDRLVGVVSEMNTTLHDTQSKITNATSQATTHSSKCVSNLDTLLQNLTQQQSPPAIQQQRRSNSIHPEFPRPVFHSSSYPVDNNASALLPTKVSNMFDELVKRSLDLEAIVKDTFTMSNVTRREVQDGFMALIPIVSQIGAAGEKEAGGVMTMVLEAVSSLEQLSTSLGRRMAEMRNSINERFELVSMTLNGFLESCLRIQDKTPQLEEKIGEVLWRILDSVDNSTRNATETWMKVKSELLLLGSKQQRNCTPPPPPDYPETGATEPPPPPPSEVEPEYDTETHGPDTHHTALLESLTEDQKNFLFLELTSRSGGGGGEVVPE